MLLPLLLPSVPFFFLLLVLRARAVVSCASIKTRHADELAKLEEVIFFECFFS
jgi:hypothetical protein